MTPLRWTRIDTSPGHFRFELRMPALQVDASVERHSNGRWFWVAVVAGAQGKSKRSIRGYEQAKISASRWVREELGRLAEEVKYAREVDGLCRDAARLKGFGHLSADHMKLIINGYIAEMPPVTDRALKVLFLEARAEIAAASERIAREAEVSA